MAFIIFLAFSLFLLQAAHGELVCEELPSGMCSFSIASSGKRCLLETPASGNHDAGLQCRTSDVMVNGLSEYIESDECVNSCGIDRNVVGISSDSLLEPQFIAKLCSSDCYDNCPNIVDLHYNLALGEGSFLPEVCEAQKTGGSRRQMAQIVSSGAAGSPTIAAAAPGPSPSIASADSSKPATYFADSSKPATYFADSPVSAPYFAGSPGSASYFADAPSPAVEP